jgi:hypothetical protein
MNSVEVPKIYGLRNGQVMMSNPVRLPDHITRGFADLAAWGKQIAAAAAETRAQRRTAFRVALKALRQRHQSMLDGLGSSDCEQIIAEVARRVDITTNGPGDGHDRRWCQRSTPTTHHLTALVTAAHAPPTRIAPETHHKRVLMP